MPTLLIPPPLEVVLQGLYDSEIRRGIQNEPPAGGITAWIDYGGRTEKATFCGTIVGDRQVWPATDIAAWMHETALRLFPEVAMPKKPRARPSLADRFCEAIKGTHSQRQTRTYAAQCVARHLGINGI